MAVSIQKRGRRQTVTVRYRGICVSSTFSTRLLAEQWADRARREIEHCLASGLPFDPLKVKATSISLNVESAVEQPIVVTPSNCPQTVPLELPVNHDWTLKRTANEYLIKYIDSKKSHESERRCVKRLQRSSLGEKLIREITAEDIYDYVHGLRHHKTGKPLADQSIRNVAYVLSAIFERARLRKFQGGFDMADLSNPVRTIHLPPPSKATRQRNVDPDVLTEFFNKLSGGRSPLTPSLVVFMSLASQTGMRRSEIIGLRWKDLRKTALGYSIYLEDTKSGYPRTVYLNEKCQQELRSMSETNQSVVSQIPPSQRRIFLFTKDFASHKFREIMTDLGYPEIRLHDLRHTALSNMANAGLSLRELMNQSGHRTASVASRYLHVDEKTIREKLNRLAF